VSKIFILHIILFFVGAGYLHAQDDSTYFKTYTPSFDNLSENPPLDDGFSLFTRSSHELLDIAANVYIIEQKEIHEKGYLTLVDVLEDVPGIVTSQPGNALDGELFMIRGFSGNYYCKILINNIPIQPSAVGGMPIGGQLPIRQAQRIEILFGPGAANYGGDAMAGVINIITNKTKKSSVIQADLTLGNNEYSQLNVLFAGKLGRIKKNVQYAVFANYAQQGNVQFSIADDSIFDPDNYYTINQTGLDYRGFNNYEYKDTVDYAPVRRDMLQESFLIGGTVSVNRMRFGYFSLARKGHSAFGLNPGAVSYADPTTTYGERIQRFTVSYEVERQFFNSRTNVSLLHYRIDNNSSQRKIVSTDDMLLYQSAALYDAYRGTGDSLQRSVEGGLAKRGKSYLFGGSDDVFIEEIVSFDVSLADGPNKINTVEFTVGANFQFSGNLPLIDNSTTPFDEEYKVFSTQKYYSNDGTVATQPFNYYNTGVFGQAFWSIQNLNILAGLRFDYHSIYQSFLSPRLAISYKINDELALRCSYNKAHRTPSSFYSGFSYSYSLDQDGEIDETFNTSLKAERLQSIEAGLRFNQFKKTQFDVTFYLNEVTDKIEKEIVKEFTNDQNDFQLNVRNGYSNVKKSSVWGIKFSMIQKDFITPKLMSKVSLSFNSAKLFYADGVLGGASTHQFNVPAFFADWHLTYRLPIPGVKLSLEVNQIISSNYHQGFVTREILNEEVTIQKEEYVAPGYYLLDFGVRYVTSSVRIEVFAYARNLLNQQISGISASNSPDDIYFNPQQGRLLQAGVSYRFGIGE
jgi:outer membrane cobalamin receptor